MSIPGYERNDAQQTGGNPDSISRQRHAMRARAVRCLTEWSRAEQCLAQSDRHPQRSLRPSKLSAAERKTSHVESLLEDYVMKKKVAGAVAVVGGTRRVAFRIDGSHRAR